MAAKRVVIIPAGSFKGASLSIKPSVRRPQQPRADSKQDSWPEPDALHQAVKRDETLVVRGRAVVSRPILPKVLPSSDEFKFLCRCCGKKLAAPEQAAGRKIKCPNCRNVIVIPKPAAVAPTPRQKELGLRYIKSSEFRFYCIRCGLNMEVARAAAGSRETCPRCRSPITIPEPPDDWV